MCQFTANIARFCAIARQGANPAASTGERAAHKLAAALNTIGDDMMLLDREAIEGFNNLALLASGPFPTDDDKSVVFDTIRKAAGK